MKRILFLFALVLTFTGCKDKNSFLINGVIEGENKNKSIYINRVDINTPVLVDSSKISSKGTFRFKVKTTEPDFYQLGLSSENFITLLPEPGEKIDLLFKSQNLYEDYSVNGSEGSEKLRVIDSTLNETTRKLDSLNTLYEIASGEPGFDVKGPLIEEEFNNLIKAQRRNSIEFIINNLTSLASIKALYQKINPETYVLYDSKDLQYLKLVTDSLTRYYPNSAQVQALARDFEKEMSQMNFAQLEQITKGLPETELDPNLEDIDGNRIALSSLRGKYVLLTFWSVKSKSCISENFQLKEFYKMYKNKGFEIYQINLDESVSDWKSAVRFDELPWISTREDDPLNPENALLFNVKNLPANFLFDKNGDIIASNLHGRTLQLKLNQLFNN